MLIGNEISIVKKYNDNCDHLNGKKNVITQYHNMLINANSKVYL